ncbi:MAG: class I SAM-dependent RNA methyltransferase, partial [Clostridiales bacterium]|nr:class I SAM-dependent RNA methyltransferase [Clostridiales bacterium]
MEDVRITGSGSELQGVGRLADGRAVFVPGALPGEEVRIEITKDAARFSEARLCEVLSSSPVRRTPDCPVYGHCGGCHARHMTYGETLKQKRQRVYDAIMRIGGVADPMVRETIGCPNPERTRNKAEFPIGKGPDGKPVIGAYAAGSHRIVPLTDCLLQKDPAAGMLKWFSDHLPKLSCASHLTGIVTRVNRAGKLMLTICADAPILPDVSKLIPGLTKASPELVSLYF